MNRAMFSRLPISKVVIALLAAPLLVILCLSGYVLWKRAEIRSLQDGYSGTARGDSIDQVVARMGGPGVPADPPPAFAAWDWEPLSLTEASRIHSMRRYRVSTPVGSMTLEFTFDADGRVVGKHSYD
jgi:hypothetical protein